MNQITIGLAGHIDHGKTSIVHSLTGKNTDSLKEEIKRGMTIDIGFAHMSQSISLIDVPGHERFIKNMVSGVSAINYAILVVAADDGIMPQTYEHLEILELLNVKSGLVVINKIDLVDSELLEIVEMEINEFIEDTFLNNCKILKTSAKTGLGIDILRNEIENLNETDYIATHQGVFRMFLDRVFIKKGFGAVVTGTVNSGSANLGDTLEILPSKSEIKIRGLQSHDKSVKQISVGDRAAVNLHSKDKLDLKRGNHIGSKNYFSLSNSIGVEIQLLLKSKVKIKHNQRIRFHLGTQEVMGRILLTGEKSELRYSALIKLEKEIVVSFNDKFIIRSYSPVTTIGGGKILDPNIVGKWTKVSSYINILFQSKSINEKIERIIEGNPLVIFSIKTLSKKMSLSEMVLKDYLSNIDNIIYLKINGIVWVLTQNQYSVLKKEIILIISNYHLKKPDRKGCLKEEINDRLKINMYLLENILNELCKKIILKVKNDIYSNYNFKIELSDNDLKIRNKIIQILDNEGFSTSSLDDLSKETNQSISAIERILKIEASNHNLIILPQNIYLTKNNYKILLEIVHKYYTNNEGLNIKNFKDLTNTTRKYAVPLLEYLDKQKITYRIGNERKINR